MYHISTKKSLSSFSFSSFSFPLFHSFLFCSLLLSFHFFSEHHSPPPSHSILQNICPCIFCMFIIKELSCLDSACVTLWSSNNKFFKCWGEQNPGSLKGLPQNEITPFFISYFDSWPNAQLKVNKHDPQNWVSPTLKVKKPCAEWSICRPFGQCSPLGSDL